MEALRAQEIEGRVGPFTVIFKNSIVKVLNYSLTWAIWSRQ